MGKLEVDYRDGFEHYGTADLRCNITGMDIHHCFYANETTGVVGQYLVDEEGKPYCVWDGYHDSSVVLNQIWSHFPGGVTITFHSSEIEDRLRSENPPSRVAVCGLGYTAEDIQKLNKRIPLVKLHD